MGHWVISSALEPVYVDDKWDDPNYDSRLDPENIECMMCPCSIEECDRREVCYWDEVWAKDDEAVATNSGAGDELTLCDIVECFTLRDRRK